MRCSDAAARVIATLRSALVAVACLVCAGLVHAHKASDSYLQIAVVPAGIEVRWDIALRDLDVAIDLDGDADGKLTWGEIRAAWPRIEAYATQRLAIEGCALTATGRGLERRNDGAYAVLYLTSPCVLPAQPRIAYALFAEVDPTHRGIAKVQRPGADVVLSVLEPTVASARPGLAENSRDASHLVFMPAVSCRCRACQEAGPAHAPHSLRVLSYAPIRPF